MGLWKSRQGDHYICDNCGKRLDVTKSRPGYVPANWFIQEGRYMVAVCGKDCLNVMEERVHNPSHELIEGESPQIDLITLGKEDTNEADSEEYIGNPT